MLSKRGGDNSGVYWGSDSAAAVVRLFILIVDALFLHLSRSRFLLHTSIFSLLTSAQLVVWSHSFIVRSLRILHLNHLTGTIPPELGNITQLKWLYVQIRIVILYMQ